MQSVTESLGYYVILTDKSLSRTTNRYLVFACWFMAYQTNVKCHHMTWMMSWITWLANNVIILDLLLTKI